MAWMKKFSATAIAAAALILVAAGTTAARADETTVRLGVVRSITSGVTAWASARGYFKDFGIKLDSSDLDTSANSIALLSQNQLDIIEGGIAAGYFNGLEKDLPITMVMDRVSTPIGHNLMLRPDLKGEITETRTLRGKVIATNGTVPFRPTEIGKLSASAGSPSTTSTSESPADPATRRRVRQQGNRRRSATSAVRHPEHQATSRCRSCPPTS